MGSIPTRSRHCPAGRGRAGGVRPGPTAGVLVAAFLAALPGVAASATAQVTDSSAVAARAESSEAAEPTEAGEPAMPVPSLTDTVAPVEGAAGTGAQDRDATGPGLVPVSPMGAFLRSLVLPGWGQVSVDQPGRGAFYFVMEAGSLYMLLKSQARLDAARRELDPDDDLIASREEQVEDWAVLAGFWALFAGIDAWISAQLWDFEGEVVPPPDGSPGVALRYSIPAGP